RSKLLSHPVEDPILPLDHRRLRAALRHNPVVVVGIGFLQPTQQVGDEQGTVLVVALVPLRRQPPVTGEVVNDEPLKVDLPMGTDTHTWPSNSSRSCSAADTPCFVTSIWPVTATVMRADRRSCARSIAFWASASCSDISSFARSNASAILRCSAKG